MPGYAMGADPTKIPPRREKRYGVRLNLSGTVAKLTRLYDSVGKTFVPTKGSTAGRSDFDSQPIFRDIRLCNLVEGTVTAYEGEQGFSRTPAQGDVMVEIPRFYYRVFSSLTYRDYVISDQPLEGFQISPRHAPTGHNPKGYDKIYVSAYFLDSSTRSLAGQAPKQGLSLPLARENCLKRGAGYHLMDFATYWTVGLLFLVEVANLNASTGVGYGVGTGSAPLNSGGADALGFHSGCPVAESGSGANPVKYRHLEH